MPLALVFSIIIALVHYWSEKIKIINETWYTKANSFVAGISVTYVFLSLLPELYSSFENIRHLVFIFLIVGFTTVHVAEKYLYKQKHRKVQLLHSLKEVHSFAFFAYYFLLGTILVELTSRGPIQGFLFFLPILFYAGIGIVALEKIHHKVTENTFLKAALSASTVLGVIMADFLLSARIIFDSLFALVVGAFIYIVLIDFIPREKNGDPIYFSLGVIIYTALISILLF